MTTSQPAADKTIEFKDGDTIYRQGSEPTGVYMVLSGRVEIWHDHSGEKTFIAAIGDGELLGEVSAIEDTPHSVTAKASGDVSCLYIPITAFRRSFADPLVRRIVHTLAARLRSSYVTSETTGTPSHRQDGRPKTVPVLEAGSKMVAASLMTYVELKDFPFQIGGFTGRPGKCMHTKNQLKLPLGHLAELSESHFEIITRDGDLWVRDLGSSQGTIVNGRAISRYAMSATEKLKAGENTVIAGGPDSPVRFVISLPDSF